MTIVLHTPGSTVGGYKLVNLLGKGLGGEVWAAVNKGGTVFALKLFSAGTSRNVAEAEYNMGSALGHPNLLTPLSFLNIDGSFAIVSPLCEGRSVDNAAGYFNEVITWKLIFSIGAALAYLHAGNLCHGDVKPSNILRKGNDFMLADFGSCFETKTGHPAGDLSSYLFAAPESIKTGKSDIWSLGATVFNLVMGSLVFNGLGGKAQNKESEIPFMRKSLPELSSFVARCLVFDPSSRPSASQVVSLADENLKRLSGIQKTRPLKIAAAPSVKDAYDSFWPETMKDAL